MLEVINPHVTKILLAVEDGDSIKRVAQKAGGSYGWTHNWIQRLEEMDVVARDEGIAVEDEAFRDAYTAVAQTVLRREIDREDAYLLPNFSGLTYRYAQTDAVFMWTKGGYQIGRSQDDYPIFIDVQEADIDEWTEFFAEFGQDYRIGERADEADGIYYVLFPQDAFEVEWVEHAAVPPLDETVAWAQDYAVNFQPALEMMDEMYDIGIDVTYRERETL